MPLVIRPKHRRPAGPYREAAYDLDATNAEVLSTLSSIAGADVTRAAHGTILVRKGGHAVQLELTVDQGGLAIALTGNNDLLLEVGEVLPRVFGPLKVFSYPRWLVPLGLALAALAALAACVIRLLMSTGR